MALVDAAIDTTRKRVLYREFIIIENGPFWEFSHEDYRRTGAKGFGIVDDAFSIFDAIAWINYWYDSQEEAS